MANKFSTFVRKAIIAVLPRNSILKRKLNSRIVFRGLNKAGFGGRGVYLEGMEYEPELATLPRFLSSNSVFIDIGANSGIYSILAAGFLTRGTVISYEPFPLMSNFLLQNVIHNKLPNVRVRTFGISNENSSKSFYMNMGKPNSFSFSRNVDDALEVQLFTRKLDDAILMEGIDRIDYIKIDAEGEEEKVIEGAAGIIKTFRPIIQTEALFGKIPAIDDYVMFHVKDSVNNVYIPRDSEKVEVAHNLGWAEA
ncbi:MAG TPA: FkbM family methyltransferase [Puia sp.]|jgi:FkbM family methyltransferase